jgi:hypothetical protein
MNRPKNKRFLRQRFRYAMSDAADKALRWPTRLSAALLGYVLPKTLIAAIPSQITNDVAVAAACWIIGFAVHLLAALFKAHSRIAPLAVKVTDDVRSPDVGSHHQVRGYNVAVIVRNRSDAHLKDCAAYVMNAPQADGSTGPRCVEKFDLPPKSKKTVFVAYWFSREPFRSDDKDIGLTGVVSERFDGNVCGIRGPAAILHVRIDPRDANSKDVHCRVWIDENVRRLRAAPLPD